MAKSNSGKIPGLTEQELALLKTLIPKSCETWVFGSRATGTFRPFSDLDICLRADSAIGDELMSQLHEAFQNSNLPYKVDLVDYRQIAPDFRDMIMKTARRVA